MYALQKPLPEYTGADETYETCFNKGTYALACGDYAEAEKLLTRARGERGFATQALCAD